MKVLVTGGAGFIGSHLVDALVRGGHRVTILDNLTPQVHRRGKPTYLNREADFIHGDVADRETLARAVQGVDAVAHLAAAVGVAQSNYEVRRYVETNTLGTATLFDVLIKTGGRPRVVLPGSMVCYGEGLYRRADGALVRPDVRSRESIEKHGWEPVCPDTGAALAAVPTPEDAAMNFRSVYALTKYDQERMAINLGQLHSIPVTVLRFFNVYGPRQSLCNPYTGVTAIFMARIKNGKPPIVYEDGGQTRDFVSVHDAVRVIQRALSAEEPVGGSFNVGSGVPTAIGELARMMAAACGSPVQPEITSELRAGDIRHCFADIGRARARLGFEPLTGLAEGMAELVRWAQTEEAEDLYEQAATELREMGIL